jgi:hypothetical protein
MIAAPIGFNRQTIFHQQRMGIPQIHNSKF